MVADVSEEEVKRPPVSNKKLGLFSPAPFFDQRSQNRLKMIMRMAVIGIKRNNSYDVSGK